MKVFAIEEELPDTQSAQDTLKPIFHEIDHFSQEKLHIAQTYCCLERFIYIALSQCSL